MVIEFINIKDVNTVIASHSDWQHPPRKDEEVMIDEVIYTVRKVRWYAPTKRDNRIMAIVFVL